MRRLILKLSIAFLIILNSCNIKINTAEFINSNQRLTLKFNSEIFIHKVKKDTIIDYNSMKYIQLKKWFMDNSEGWQSSPASYAHSDMTILGDNFGFLIFKNFVVIGFVDRKGKSRQFTKSVTIDTFDFLLK
jgi:hypothetical protein